MAAARAAALDSTWLARWGRFVQRHRVPVFLASLVVGASVLSLFAVAGPFKVGGEPSTATESGREFAALKANLPDGAKPSFILILGDDARAWTDAAFKQDVQDALAPVAADSRVSSVVSPYNLPAGQGGGLVSKDGHKVLAIVTLDLEQVAAEKAYDEVRGKATSGTLHIVGTGGLALGSDFQKVFQNDMPRTQTISLPLTLVVLVIVFGAVVAAFVPLAVGFLAVGGGIALTGLLANWFSLPDWSTQLVSLIALGVAIDYCLFIVNRFREEMDDGNNRETALGRALATSGHAVIFSGLTVAVSLGGLAFFDGLQFAAAGYAVACAVAFAVLLAMSLLPAILAMLGPRINRLHLGPRRKATATKDSGFWHGLAGGVMRFPVAFTVLVLLIVGVLATPLAGIRFGGFSPQQLPPEFESREGFDLLATDFARQGASEIDAVLQWSDGAPRSAEHLGALWDYSHAAAGIAHVVGVESLADLVPGQSRDAFIQQFQGSGPTPPGLVGGSITVVKVHLDVVADDPAATAAVKAMRTLPHPAGGDVLVGGFTAQTVDTVQLIQDRLPFAATFIVLSTLVILMVQVRSLILPVKAVVMNLLSVAASFGLAVWIFQDGHFSSLLNFTPTGLEPGNLVLMFCIVFGLSMDYEVMLLSRMHEAYVATGDNRKAVQRGLASSGRIITGAALIMVFVFGAFGIVRITFMKVIGVGLAFAVLFDATVIRALLVPALMRLMGSANWYAPRWMRPAQPIPDAAPNGEARPGRVPAAPPNVVKLARRQTATTPYAFTVRPRFTDPDVQAWFEQERARR